MDATVNLNGYASQQFVNNSLEHNCQSGSCQHDDSRKQQESNAPNVFDIVKAGMLMPLQQLVEKCGVETLSSRDADGHTVAHWVCLGGEPALLSYLRSCGVAIDTSSEHALSQRPVHWACSRGHVGVVDSLLAAGTQLDATDAKGCTPLIVACQYGQTKLAAYLVSRGAALQAVDQDGDTALHWAAFKGHSELMRLLIYAGLSPHQKDKYAQAPLHLACISGSLAAVQQLCELDKVEMTSPDNRGKTPLILAQGRRHDSIISYLSKESEKRTSFISRIDFWAIVFGPPGNSKNALVFFVVNMLFWAYPMYLYRCLPVTWYDLQTLHLVFMMVNALMWVALIYASTTDPGYVPRNNPQYDLAMKQVAHFVEVRSEQSVLSRLCHTCRTVRPLRSKHCRVCNRCVEMFDHHCPYIYNCVGKKNSLWFGLFLVTVLANNFICLYFCAYLLYVFGWDWFIGIGLIESIFFMFITCIVFVFTVYQTLVNLTTNERINKARYDYLKDGAGRFYNPYDRGWRTNLLEYLHLVTPRDEGDVRHLNITVM